MTGAHAWAGYERFNRLVRHVIAATDPARLVLAVPDLPRGPVLAIGKAAGRMAEGLFHARGDAATPDHCLVITTDHSPVPMGIGNPRVIVAGHPLPDARSIDDARHARAFIRSARARGETDLVVLLSGGASALLCEPIDGLTLDDIRAVTGALLRGGADIHELNAVRRAIDSCKGGGLARDCHGLRVTQLILSDVLGDPLHDIGSGPFVADPMPHNRRAALARFLPRDEFAHVYSAVDCWRDEGAIPSVTSHILANNATAVAFAAAFLQKEGFIVFGDDEPLTGPVLSQVWMKTSQMIHALRPGEAIVLGGEWTVASSTIARSYGGRCQSLLAMHALTGLGEGVTEGAFATDGIDGVCPPWCDPPAGVVLGPHVHEYIKDSPHARAVLPAIQDSHTWLSPIATDLRELGYPPIRLFTGPTGTNLNDLFVAWREHEKTP